MWTKAGTLATCLPAVLAFLVMTSLVTLGASPKQGGLPPQPFFPDTVSGSVILQGKPAPAGAKLVACIGDCGAVFESAPMLLSHDGSFSGLKVDPEDQRLVGHQIGFYLINEFGRIRASETVVFQGGGGNAYRDPDLSPGHARAHAYSNPNPNSRLAIAGRPGGDGHSQIRFSGGSNGGGCRGFLAIPGQAPGILTASPTSRGDSYGE